jgi:ribonuclease R
MYISEDITDLNYSKLEGEIDVLADKSSKAERRAVDLERDVTRMKMAEYMENMIGEVFVGNISGMIESGMFIELDNTIEGMIKFETIRSDFLIFDPKRMVVYSRGSKKEYHLGDPLKVICLAASKETGKIEFTLVNERKKESKPKERKHSKKRHK